MLRRRPWRALRSRATLARTLDFIRGCDVPLRGVIFDLFHTLTGVESEWSGLPWTSDALGIERRVWNEALTQRSRWRLTGEVRDPVEIVRALAHAIDPTISEETV